MNDVQNKQPALLMFHGDTCSFCRRMDPLVEQLEKETGVKVEKYEVWRNEENATMLARYDQGYCGGVPFFFNAKTQQWICGAVSYEDLKLWALGN